jgi:hypothetical protein
LRESPAKSGLGLGSMVKFSPTLVMLKWIFLPFILLIWVFWLRSYLVADVESWQPAKGYVQQIRLEEKPRGRFDALLEFWYLDGNDTVRASELFDSNISAEQKSSYLKEKLNDYPKGKVLDIQVNPKYKLEATAFPELTKESQKSTVWGYLALFSTVIWLVWVFKANPKPSPKP